MHTPSIDRLVRETAGRSYDVISWHELEAIGVTKRVLARLVRDGVLRRIHRGVYTTARVLSVRGRLWPRRRRPAAS